MNILRRIWYHHRNKVREKTGELLMNTIKDTGLCFLEYHHVEPVIHPVTGEILTEYAEFNFKWSDNSSGQIIITDIYNPFEVEYFVKFLKKWHYNGYSYEMLCDAYPQW